jgi:DnaK suppressor protein
VPGHDDVLQEAEGMLDAVDAALFRLADGSYGTCARCGASIGEHRLSMVPTTDLCAAHDLSAVE